MHDSKQSQPFRKNKQKPALGARPATAWNKKKSGDSARSESDYRPKEKKSFRSDDSGYWQDRRGGGEDKPAFSSRPYAKKPFGKKPYGNKPFEKKPFGKPSRSFSRPERSEGPEISSPTTREFSEDAAPFEKRERSAPFPRGHRRFRKDRDESQPRESSRPARAERGERGFDRSERGERSDRRDRQGSSRKSSYFPKEVGAPRERSAPQPNAIAEVSPVLSDEAQAKIEKSKITIPGKQTEKVSVGTQIPFTDFDLPEEILEALERAEFTFATPIQAESLPHSLAGRDVMGCAQTGTGKTAAFALPMIKTLMEDPSAMALVLAPTRELADQIVDTLRKLRTPDLSYTLLIGGASFTEQVRSLRRRPNVIVATPGRLVDHIQQRTVNLQKVKFFVLDEADRMFDMGFAPQIQKVTAQITGKKQTLLFSATFSKEVKQLALNTLVNPIEVFVGETSSVASGVNQEIIEILPDQKLPKLLDELNKREGSVLLFVGMKYRADRLAKSLRSYGHYVDSIHSDRTQGQRRAVLQNFRDQRIRILVATDVAARGLDIPHVAHVINYDLPNDPEDYVHRLGRTARAGAIGSSLSFITDEDRGSWVRIAKMLKVDGGKSSSPTGRNKKRSGGNRKRGFRGRR